MAHILKPAPTQTVLRGHGSLAGAPQPHGLVGMNHPAVMDAKEPNPPEPVMRDKKALWGGPAGSWTDVAGPRCQCGAAFATLEQYEQHIRDTVRTKAASAAARRLPSVRLEAVRTAL